MIEKGKMKQSRRSWICFLKSSPSQRKKENERNLFKKLTICQKIRTFMDSIPTAKVIVLGNSSVGKSSIVMRFGKDSFEESPSTTIGAAYITKPIRVNEKDLAIHLWDTAGQERFRSIIPMYVRGCSAVLLICSTDNEESVGELDVWKKLVEDHAKNVKTRFIVMNKIDIPNQQLQTSAAEYARVNSFEYMEVSAKENIGITDLFQCVGEKIFENNETLLNDNGSSQTQQLKPAQPPKEKKNCC